MNKLLLTLLLPAMALGLRAEDAPKKEACAACCKDEKSCDKCKEAKACKDACHDKKHCDKAAEKK